MSVLDDIRNPLFKRQHNKEQQECYKKCSLDNILCTLNTNPEDIKNYIQILEELGFAHLVSKYDYKILPIVSERCSDCPYKMKFGLDNSSFCIKLEYYEVLVEDKQKEK